MDAASWRQTGLRKTKSLSQSHTATAEPGLRPKGARLQSSWLGRGWSGGEAGVTRHQRRLERWARSLTCSLPGATFVSQRLSLTPQTVKHPPWPVPGLFIKLHFAILTPSWPPCSQGEGIAQRGGMASRPQTIGSPDLQA